MSELNIDFDGTSSNDLEVNAEPQPTTQEKSEVESTPIDGHVTEEDVTGKDNTPANNEPKDNQQTDNQEEPLAVGTEVEVDGATYVVSEQGDLVDKDGNVFKQASELKEWLDNQNIEDESEDDDLSSFSIGKLQNEIGVTVTDEQGKPVEFTNDAAGVKNYINSVIDIKANEIRNGALNKLFSDNPLLKEFIDYVTVTGTPRGFGNIPDRSDIKLDKDNESQLEAVIRMAGQEFNNPSINENYIKYLKSTGALYDEAEKQLGYLVEKDKQLRQQLQAEADQRRRAEEEYNNNYWARVNDVISSRSIGGYKIPESFVKTVDGKKMTLTPNDFANYLYKAAYVDDNGNYISAYQRDINSLSDEDLLNKDLLDAWLMFTGGTYKDLVDMAAKENNVRKLIIKSKEQRNNKTVRINKPKSKVSVDDIIF